MPSQAKLSDMLLAFKMILDENVWLFIGDLKYKLWISGASTLMEVLSCKSFFSVHNNNTFKVQYIKRQKIV